MDYKFHNPYNFVRTPNRGHIKPESFAGDHDPSKIESREDHSRYWHERYTGEIPVKLRTFTPLFITNPDTETESVSTDGHYIYDCMSEIPATALKGMLSSAYEIITNSRYRIFSEQQHTRRLGYRYTANASLVPAMVIQGDNGQLRLKLFTGNSSIGANGRANGPLYAAWLPTYKDGKIKHKLENGRLYKNVKLALYLYYYRNTHFKFWSVESIDGINLKPITGKASPAGATITVDGYVVISDKTIGKKHDERLFFNYQNEVKIIDISDEVKKSYEELIRDYQETHRFVNGKRQNDAQPGTILGRHITEEYELKLKPGRFVYADTDGRSLKAIYPVQISRELSKASPWECLDETLRPARLRKNKESRSSGELANLSPADRLFGWISQKGSGAWKGKIRISCGVCTSSEPVTRFSKPLPLTILGGPKPSQARFYLGDEKGMPQKNGIPKQNASYVTGKKIRGRKVYLHHALKYLQSKEDKEAYWDPDRNKSIIREYSYFPSDTPHESNQNRSISGWIPKKTDFLFKIRFENLTEEELGALLKLLSMDNDFCFRLGYGKPLGLGSVKLSIEWDVNGNIPVMTGKALRERYMSLDDTPDAGLSKERAQSIIKKYQEAMADAYGNKNNTQKFKFSDLESELDELMSCYNEKQKAEFKSVWQNALERGDKSAPLDDFPESEIIRELLESEPELKNKLDDLYNSDKKTFQDFAKYDFGWSNIDFIKDFIAAMKGFDEPVAYPRNSYNSGKKGEKSAKDEKGFEWFVENERGRPLPGYSLPLIGTPLKGFEIKNK